LAELNTISEGAAKILQPVCESRGWEYGLPNLAADSKDRMFSSPSLLPKASAGELRWIGDRLRHN
jgi:hypothetical protein